MNDDFDELPEFDYDPEDIDTTRHAPPLLPLHDEQAPCSLCGWPTTWKDGIQVCFTCEFTWDPDNDPEASGDPWVTSLPCANHTRIGETTYTCVLRPGHSDRCRGVDDRISPRESRSWHHP